MKDIEENECLIMTSVLFREEGKIKDPENHEKENPYASLLLELIKKTHVSYYFSLDRFVEFLEELKRVQKNKEGTIYEYLYLLKDYHNIKKVTVESISYEPFWDLNKKLKGRIIKKEISNYLRSHYSKQLLKSKQTRSNITLEKLVGQNMLWEFDDYFLNDERIILISGELIPDIPPN